MAKDKITEYDATANNNTVCGDVNIAENSALPSDMNNFAREIMSHLKEGLGSGTPLFVDQTNNRLGINTSSPATALDVTGTVTAGGLTVNGDSTVDAIELTTSSSFPTTGFTLNANGFSYEMAGSSGKIFRDDGNNKALMQISNNNDISFYEDTGTTPKFFWDASAESLGIGTTSPTLGSTGYGLHIKGGTNKDGTLKLDSTTANYSGVIQFTENGTDQWRIAYDGTNNHLEFTESGVADRMVIQDGGNVGIGTSSPTSLLSVFGTIALERAAISSKTTAGDFSIALSNLPTLSGSSWRQINMLVFYGGVDFGLSNSTANLTNVRIRGLNSWNDVVVDGNIIGTATISSSSASTTGVTVTFDVPDNNHGSVFVLALGGTQTPSISITG